MATARAAKVLMYGSITNLCLDTTRSGLPCRADNYCRALFAGDVATAARERDGHERSQHGYVHVTMPTPGSWLFTEGFSARGRSRLGRHHASR